MSETKTSDDYKVDLLNKIDEVLDLIKETLEIATESHKTALQMQHTENVNKSQFAIDKLIKASDKIINSKDELNKTSEIITADSYKTGLHCIEMSRIFVQHLNDTIKQTIAVHNTKNCIMI